MRKFILFDILVISVTALILLANIIFAKSINQLVRNVVFATNVDAFLLQKNCINDSFSDDTPVFLKKEYEIYSNNEYLCLMEFILNNGEVYSFSFSGSTGDENYDGLEDFSKITLLCQNKIQSASFVKQLSSDEVDKLSNLIDNVNDTQSQEYAVIDSDNSSHNVDIWGFSPTNKSLILFYSLKNKTAAVSADKNAQQVLSSLLLLFD